ncbi:wall-associated receptor kinase 2-like [Papaver somniferum]|uniref:wall-associated receptor kinase 2-like n=1 Tax=Papaver somniferum TaxID=3469 RepID=UPI000E704B90|nr:wall-associated receptor kinase 2-like [Papaver somniferum]
MNYTGTCHSQCDTRNKVIEGSCTGSGCCSTPIPKGVYGTYGNVTSNLNEVWPFNPCSYTFTAETESFKFSALDLVDMHRKGKEVLSVVMAIGTETCIEAQKNSSTYQCHVNTSCVDPIKNPGYRCVCHEGYEGNPYLKPGCKDINECEDGKSNLCTNTIGSYSCSCPDGISGYGRKDGSGCVKHEFPILGVTLGVGLGLLAFLLIGSCCLYLIIHKRNLMEHRKIYFEQNGGLLLKQKLSANEVGVDFNGNIFSIRPKTCWKSTNKK